MISSAIRSAPAIWIVGGDDNVVRGNYIYDNERMA